MPALLSLPPKLDTNVGSKSHLFQPPKTPSASTSLHKSTASLSNQHANPVTSRKRPRLDPYCSHQATPFTPQSHTSPSDLFCTSSPVRGSASFSPSPFVNTQYRLAGGLDTPTAHLIMDEDTGEHSLSLDIHLPRGSRGFQSPTDSYFPQPISALSRETNGRPRQHVPPRTQNGLGKAVYEMMSAAGKVWDFCRTTAFKGFYAGTGQGFPLKPPLEHMSCGQSIWREAQPDDVIPLNLHEKTLVPGCFPEEDFIPDYMECQNNATPPRAAKKIRREKGISADMSASWVLLSRETSPARTSVLKNPPLDTSARRPKPKLGRRPILPASRPSLTSFAGSPGVHSDRRASFALPRSPITLPKREIPLSAEVQRHATKMRKREMEEDADLTRFNQQLKAMIKEGKEALGTKFEVLELGDEDYTVGECVYDCRD